LWSYWVPLKALRVTPLPPLDPFRGASTYYWQEHIGNAAETRGLN